MNKVKRKGIVEMAKAITHLCVRNNTPLEDFHVKHHISDEEMKAFNKAVVDNLYNVLLPLLAGSDADKMQLIQVLSSEAMQVRDWDVPSKTKLVSTANDVLSYVTASWEKK